MISILTLIYIGGFSFLYTQLIYHGLSSDGESQRNPSNNPQTSEETAPTRPEMNSLRTAFDIDEEYEDDDDRTASYTEQDDFSNYSWKSNSRLILTFKHKNNCGPHSVFDPLKPKTVRFHPISEEHVTFSKEDYRRRNHELLEKISEHQRSRSRLERIYSELKQLKAGMLNVEI